MYRSGLVPTLLLTGGGANPEARRMADVARTLGVPDADLIVEDRSSSTFENAQFSVEVLRQRGVLDGISSILLISSEWHMRRVLLTARRYFPSHIRFTCCPTSEGCTRDNWMSSDACRREVEAEARLLSTFLMTGALEMPSESRD